MVGFGVYKQDCYKFTEDMAYRNLIEIFHDFGNALKFSYKYPNSAIHFTEVWGTISKKGKMKFYRRNEL